MSKAPLVSVIIPIYNAGKYLSEAIESIINQTYKNLEIICVNDGSTDNSLEIIQKYAKIDNRIKVLSQENAGASAARNFGIDNSSGEYITFMDADDTCKNTRIEKWIKIILNDNSDVLFEERNKLPFMGNACWEMIVKKSLLDNNADIKYLNKSYKYNEDWIYTHKLFCMANRVSFSNNKSYFYRPSFSQTTNMSNDKLPVYYKNKIDILNELIAFYNQKNLWEKYNDNILYFILESTFSGYLKCDFNRKMRNEIFNIIHSAINDYNIKINLTYTTNREKLFAKFLKCQKEQDFTFWWILSYVYIRIKSFIRRLKSLTY